MSLHKMTRKSEIYRFHGKTSQKHLRRRYYIRIWMQYSLCITYAYAYLFDFRHSITKCRLSFHIHKNFFSPIFSIYSTYNQLLFLNCRIREWASGKLVEYESLRVSNGRVESGRVGSKMVKLQVDMRVYTEKFQFFNVKYHAITEIVKCESG